ncbi:GAF domain-containing protein [Calycomorphotria hydatis]|uniref:GAF domain-containing protein n=1 Tax=Calycomorphotria hydatis TaxID=2528027 RepID=A0A517T5Z2_9PLAN|nr:GAF domain-containing protein [Calycomorphotria hydatis]QDT63789.1 hypothetical protein V22_10140 [Calycomorphotria hydatis]
METFVKATEIWMPNRDYSALELVTGNYGPLDDFRIASEQSRFFYDEGLPGRAWAARHPIVLKDLQNSYFQRKEEALAAGITAGIAVPIFAGQCLQGVIVMLCGDSGDKDTSGAIEVWSCDTTDSYDLSLMDGYFGKLERFELLSKHILFRKGTGLPGLVWERGLPVILEDLGSSHRFIRSEGAVEAGITTGLGIPLYFDRDEIFVLCFLTARGTPIVRQMEIWMPDENNNSLHFDSGHSDVGKDLAAEYSSTVIDKGEGALGKAFLHGVPSFHFESGDDPLDLSSLLVIPVLKNGWCKSVVALYL